MQETAMISKTFAAAAAGLCLAWGAAYAGPEVQDSQPRAAAPAEVPEAAGPTNDVIVLEVGPMMQGGAASTEEAAAMQMLLLQLLMMQSEMDGGEMQMIAPGAEPGTAI
jgi:hypothetical protein